MRRPLCIELFCGTFGWSAGWLAMGGQAVGFDIEHEAWHGPIPAGAELVLQDVLTLHGSQFRHADLILASSPCQEYSYMAMPWSRAKQAARALRGEDVFPDDWKGSRTIDELNALFLAPRRIQREASEAAGRHIPMIQENVVGAQKWVGRAQWHFGSYYLWGDVPALMPPVMRGVRVPGMGAGWRPPDDPKHQPGLAFNGTAERHMKNSGGSWFNIAPHNKEKGRNPDGRHGGKHQAEELKCGGAWFGKGNDRSLMRQHSSKSSARKAASAHIARIPLRLSEWIAEVYWPSDAERAA